MEVSVRTRSWCFAAWRRSACTAIARLSFLSVLVKRGANPTIRENAQAWFQDKKCWKSA